MNHCVRGTPDFGKIGAVYSSDSLSLEAHQLSIGDQGFAQFWVKRKPVRCVQCWEPPARHMSDQFIYLQLKFIPKIGHTFTDEREVVVEVPKNLVQRKSESINEGLREVIALDLAKSAALGTFPTELERAPEVYDEAPPNWYSDRPAVMNERACDYEENGTRAWRIASKCEG